MQYLEEEGKQRARGGKRRRKKRKERRKRRGRSRNRQFRMDTGGRVYHSKVIVGGQNT